MPSTLLAAAERALHAADPTALLVPPRILRRVILKDRELPGFGFQIRHQKGYVLSRSRLLRFAAPDELGLAPDAELPATVILIARPDEDDLAGTSLEALAGQFWRVLFHARVKVALKEKLASAKLTVAGIRDRIHRIGQAEFDEIHAVLRQENCLSFAASHAEAYVEFAALYLELRYFSESCLAAYFPSLEDWERIDEILAEDVDAAALFARTRLEGAAGFVVDPQIAVEESGPTGLEAPRPPVARKSSERVFSKLVRRAQKASAWGNTVRAAILRARAVPYARPEAVAEALAGVGAELDRLTRRLQAALAFSEVEARAWREALQGLVNQSREGFWNADARLLYDLQKVCVDHEREIYGIDLLGWFLSFGRRPIKRPLPNQREVLMSKHLRSAAGRLAAARLSGKERERLSTLLHAAAGSAEDQLRARLRPLIGRTLDEVGMRPRNLPEKVAFEKLIEELLDAVVQNGFLTMGNLRDAISRNNLKLDDLSGLTDLGREILRSASQFRWERPGEGIRILGRILRLPFERPLLGDRLLRANARLSVQLDGVYRRGEFYLRWLQGLSSLAFGTPLGRFITQFIVIPFGGAYVALIGLEEGLKHLLQLFGQEMQVHVDPRAVAALGLFLLALLHVEPLRRQIANILLALYRGVRGVVYDIPSWFLRLPWVRAVLRSPPVVLLRRYVIHPGVAAGLTWLALPLMNIPQPAFRVGGTALFVVWSLVLNSRMGRDIEEVTAEWIERTWHQIRVRIFVALFQLVMETFKQILEGFERVLYAVDEWLRYKSGENVVTLAVKALLGVLWSVVTFVTRIYVTLLIEPQVNPIKHFPVVTVSHKIILPFSVVLTHYMAQPLLPVLGRVAASTIAMTTVFLLPGVFGFLVWELKENWRLYAANRSEKLKPALVGQHGETLIRLMKPGLHSGTLPKLYGKLRHAERQADLARRAKIKAKCYAKLHHMEHALRCFVEREFIRLLTESRHWGPHEVAVGKIEIASNSLRIELRCPALAASSLWLAFQEQSGWLVASVANSGWLLHLAPEQRAALGTALAGFYKIGGVDLVREQIEACFEPQTPPYDINDVGLAAWPGGRYDVEISYDLRERPVSRARPRALARSSGLPDLNTSLVLLSLSSISWQNWVEAWEAERSGEPPPQLLPGDFRLLPEAERLPLRESPYQPVQKVRLD